MLSIILDKVGNNGLHHSKELVIRFAVFNTDFIFLTNITCQVADILMSPLCEVFVTSL
jgi:hypothetical protein